MKSRAKKDQLALRGDALDVERAREYLRSTRDLDRIVEIRDAAKLKVAYDRLRQNGVDAEQDARRLVVLADHRIGQLLIETKKAGGIKKGGDRRSKSSTNDLGPSLAELGLSKDVSSRCQKLAKLDERVLEKKMDELARLEQPITAKAVLRDRPPISETSDYASDEYYTPPEYIESARKVLGGTIDLDPASCDLAQETVRATTYYTEKDDGLSKEWAGTTFMNPPYSKIITRFVEKFYLTFEARAIPSGIVLVHNCTDTRWCQDMLHRFDVCFTDGRIPFLHWDPAKKKLVPAKSPRQGQAFFYAGQARGAFADEFRQYGAIMRRAA